MGFIQAFAGALGGSFADQWKDFLTVPPRLPQTAAFFPAVSQGQNAGRGSNTKGSENIITNGSLVVVPEGYGLVTFENGRLTNFIAESGGYRYDTDNPNARSMFAGDGFFASTLGTSWQRFKFGGQPGGQQLAFYVALKEIPNHMFGTQSEIYWDDAMFNTQVGAIARGRYTLKVIDPVLFVANFVPALYISAGAPVLDFTEPGSDVGDQLFSEVVGTLASAFSRYVNDSDKGHRITAIQSDSVGFAQSLAVTVEENYQWATDRGLAIAKATIEAIEYDEDTQALLSDVKKADALGGARGDSFLKQSAARGIEGIGQNGGGGADMGMFGVGMGALGGMGVFGNNQQQQPAAAAPAPAAPVEKSPIEQLREFKMMLEEDLITQEEFDAKKKEILG